MYFSPVYFLSCKRKVEYSQFVSKLKTTFYLVDLTKRRDIWRLWRPVIFSMTLVILISNQQKIKLIRSILFYLEMLIDGNDTEVGERWWSQYKSIYVNISQYYWIFKSNDFTIHIYFSDFLQNLVQDSWFKCSRHGRFSSLVIFCQLLMCDGDFCS